MTGPPFASTTDMRAEATPRHVDPSVREGVAEPLVAGAVRRPLVPLRNGKRVLVLGNYQAGTWVGDFTDPANARTVARSDPPPLIRPTLVGPGRRTGTRISSTSPRSRRV